MKIQIRKLGFIALCAAVLGTIGNDAFACSPDQFSDVDTPFERGVVYYACKYGFPPKTSSEFGVGETFTKATVAPILTEAFGITVKSSYASYAFSDVPSTSPYRNHIQALYEAGVVQGNETHSYTPNAAFTRTLAAVVISNKYGYSYGKEDSPSLFADVDSGKWFTGPINQMKKNCIANGTGDNNYEPNANITRLQLAVFINRARNSNYRNYCDSKTYYSSCSGGTWKSQKCSVMCDVEGGGCVDCISDNDCATGKCINNSCADCSVGEVECFNNTLKTCTSSGFWHSDSCEYGCHYSGTKCNDCLPNMSMCLSKTKFQYCTNDNTWGVDNCLSSEECVDDNYGCEKKVECTKDVCMDEYTLNLCKNGQIEKKYCSSGEKCEGGACVKVAECTKDVCDGNVLKHCVDGSYIDEPCAQGKECKQNACVDVAECIEDKCEGDQLLKCLSGQYVPFSCGEGMVCKGGQCVNDTSDNSGDNPGDNTGDNPGDNTGDNPGDNTGGNSLEDQKCSDGDLKCDGSNLMICESGVYTRKKDCDNKCFTKSSTFAYCGECYQSRCETDRLIVHCVNGLEQEPVECGELSLCDHGECKTELKCDTVGEFKCATEEGSSNSKDILYCGDSNKYILMSCSEGNCEKGECSSSKAKCDHDGEVRCIPDEKLVYVCMDEQLVLKCKGDACYKDYCSNDEDDVSGEDTVDSEEDGDNLVMSSSSSGCSQQSGKGHLGWLLLPLFGVFCCRRRERISHS